VARPNWIKSLEEYYEEIHWAFNLIRGNEGIEKILLCGLGMGGLIATLFTVDFPFLPSDLLLISPQFTFNKNWQNLIDKSKNWMGRTDLTYKNTKFSQLYHQSLHHDHHGQCEWDLRLKPVPGFPVYVSWLVTVNESLDRLFGSKQSLNLPLPVLLLCSTASSTPSSWSEEVATSDVMCTVAGYVKIAPLLGECVRLQGVRDAIHDVFHSSWKEVREEAYARVFEFFEWMVDPEVQKPNKVPLGASTSGIGS